MKKGSGSEGYQKEEKESGARSMRKDLRMLRSEAKHGEGEKRVTHLDRHFSFPSLCFLTVFFILFVCFPLSSVCVYVRLCSSPLCRQARNIGKETNE